MITNLFFLIGAQILFMFSNIFSVFQLEIPEYIQPSISYFLTGFNYAHNNFPVNDALLAGLFLLAIYWRVYLIKIFLWAFSLIPIIGRSTQLPSMEKAVNNAPDNIPKGSMIIMKKFRSMESARSSHNT